MLIGLWWPAPPTQPAAAVGFWSGHKDTKQREAEGINNLITLLGQRNSGHTADDMLTRLRSRGSSLQRSCGLGITG